MTGAARRTSGMAAGAVAAAVAAAPQAWLVASGHHDGRAAFDSIVYHERFIRQLIAEFPRFDFSNPLTATTPGYHLLMACVGVAVSPSATVLRLVSVAICAVFVGAVAAWCARRRGTVEGVLLALPLACSTYVMGSGAWLLPDDLAWLLLTLTMAAALPGIVGARSMATLGALLAALVVVRQSALWAAAAAWAGAWAGAGPDDEPLPAPGATRRLGAVVLASLPAVAITAWFAATWGGLVPPRFRPDIAGANPATPAIVLVQVAILGIGFLPWLWGGLRRRWEDSRVVLAAAAFAGLLAAVLPETAPSSMESGRWSGWWGPIGALPSVGGRTSIAVLFAAPVGAVLLAAALLSVPARARLVLTAGTVAFVAAVTATFNSWQRYHEPWLLILLAMLAALQPADRMEPRSVAPKAVAMAALCALLGAISLRGLALPKVAPDEPVPPYHLKPEGDLPPWRRPGGQPAPELT